jgi:hypothetical protein
MGLTGILEPYCWLAAWQQYTRSRTTDNWKHPETEILKYWLWPRRMWHSVVWYTVMDFSEARRVCAGEIMAAGLSETSTNCTASHLRGPCAYRSELHAYNYAFLGLTSIPGYADWGFSVCSTVPMGGTCGTHGRWEKCVEDFGGETSRRDTTLETVGLLGFLFLFIFCCDSATQRGSWPPHSWGF